MTMATIIRDTADECFRNACSRAKACSSLRHAALRRGDVRSARLLSILKAAAIQRAADILPERICTRPQAIRGHDLVLVEFGERGLHLPLWMAPVLGSHTRSKVAHRSDGKGGDRPSPRGFAVLVLLIGLALVTSVTAPAQAQTASPVEVNKALPQKTDFMQTIRAEVQAFASAVRGLDEADKADRQALSTALAALEQAPSAAAAEQARERLAKVNAKILKGVDERSGSLAATAAAFGGKMADLAAIERQLRVVHNAKLKQFEARASNAAEAEENVRRALAELRDELAARGMWPLSAETPAHIRGVFSATLDAAGMAALDSGIAAKTRDAVARARRDSETRATALETHAHNAQRWAEGFKARQGTVRDVTELFASTRENGAMNRAFGETQELMAWVDRKMGSQGNGLLLGLLESIEGADVSLQVTTSASSSPEEISHRVDEMLGTGATAPKK